MKSLSLLAIVAAGLTTACTIREERTVQHPAPAAVVATPAPATVVYTDPAPATTTVYTTR